MAITVQDLKSFLKRDPMKAVGVVKYNDDTQVEQALNASAESISAWTGNKDFDTGAKVLASTSYIMKEAVICWASFLLKTSSPTAESEYNFGENNLSGKNTTLTDFQRLAVESHVINLLSLGNFRDVARWVDTEQEAS